MISVRPYQWYTPVDHDIWVVPTGIVDDQGGVVSRLGAPGEQRRGGKPSWREE